MQNSIFSWIRKQQATLQIFVAVMGNLMAFAQPLSYALNGNSKTQRKTNGNYFGSSQFVNLNQNVSASGFANNSEPFANKTLKNTTNVTTTNVLKNSVAVLPEADDDVISSIEKQGIVGKSENLPIDELTDNIFSFELKSEVKKDKDIYLEYELFGLADGSQAIKSINDQTATGGSIIKTTKEWTKVKEKVNPSDIQKGKNNIKFTTWEQSRYQYMVRNLKLVYEDKVIEMPIEFHQSVAKSYSGSIALSGFVADQSVTKISILGKNYPVVNSVFEALVDEKEPKSNLSVSYLDAKGYKIENNIKVEQLVDKPTELHKETKSFTSISKFFAKSKSNSLSFGGAKLVVDTLSLVENQKISIAGLRYVDLPTLSPEMVNVTADYYGYRMLPHGDLFSKKPAKIFLKYDHTKLPKGYTAKDIKTFYFDNDQKRWMALEKDTVLDSSNEIVSKTNHFTDFINGIIKVPESPETGSFTPTSIKDIKAAEPTAGVVSIAPPTPNNMGTVNTSFPIKLPAGRSGMQPSLSVNYSSESGNGWMGLGWDLSIPSVSLDTRWGAPRYGDVDGNGTFDNKETEIYTMGGGMLTFKDGAEYTNPHRKDNLTSSAERPFYPRIEGSYAKIIRHGNNPNNYWWEVTDKMGNKSFYGGYDGAVKNNAVIRTGYNPSFVIDKSDGNIAYWGLCRTEDTNGNFVEYVYDNNYGIGVGGLGDNGNEFYIKEIKYTMHKTINQPNYYKVEFKRTGGRVDKQINARNGVVQVTKDLLTEIKIGLQTVNGFKPIRSYGFEYKTPSQQIFYKTQLTKISEFDANGDLFYSNSMEYEKLGSNRAEVTNSNFMQPNIDERWNVGGDDGLKGDLISGNAIGEILSPEFTNRPSLLGSSENGGANGGFYIGFGFGFTPDIRGTFGPNYNYSYSSGGGLISFTDVNGDGLPDKVFKQNGILKFKPNLGNGFGTLRSVNDISNISRNVSHSHSFGFQASFGVFAGATYNTSKNITSTYFSDVNGDGLTDLIDNGTVQFNKTNKTNYLNQSDFSSTENGKTPNPIGAGAISTTIVNSIQTESLDQLRDENPQHDIVKVWIAKKNGTINITGNAFLEPYPSVAPNLFPTPVSLTNPTVFNPLLSDYDGVRLSIQKNDGTGSILKEGVLTPTFLNNNGTVTPNNMAQAFSNPLTTVTVIEGDRIYFRVQSKEEGSFDRVNWNPSINYSTASINDANGLDYFSSSASEGFIVSADSGFKVTNQLGATYSIDWQTINLNAFDYSDDLIFEIEKKDFDNTTGLYSNPVLYSMFYDQVLASNLSISSANFNGNNFQTPTAFNSNPQIVPVYYFRVKSKSNVNWKSISWNPRITINPAVVANNNQVIKIYPVVNYQIYNKKIFGNVVSRIDGLNPTSPLVIKPIINLSFLQAQTYTSLPDNRTYTFNLVIKNNQKRVIASRSIFVEKISGNVAISSDDVKNIDINNNITSTIFVEYYTSDVELADLCNDPSVPIKADVYQANTSPVVLTLNPTPPTTTIPSALVYLNSVKFQTLDDPDLPSFPFYENRSNLTNNPNLIKGANYPFIIQLETTNTNQLPSGHVAVWVDYNRNGVIDVLGTNEFFRSTSQSSFHQLTVPIPNTVSDGNILIRVWGGRVGSTNLYTATNVLLSNIPGTVRDYKANVVSYTNKFSKDVYCAVENDKFGVNYRGWGQFAYHGGIIVERADMDLNNSNIIEPNEKQLVKLYTNPVNPAGPKIPNVTDRYGEDINGNIVPIKESELKDYENVALTICNNQNPNGGQPLIDCINSVSIPPSTSIRFFRLNPNNEKIFYSGSSEFVNVDALHFSTSRLGVKNLKTIFFEPPTSVNVTSSSCLFPSVGGISLINKGDGYSVSGGVSAGPVGFGGNYSTSFNWAETSYIDMNGDRYPDILTKDYVQYTGALGGLKETQPLNFGRVSSGDSSSWGATASGTFVTAKTPGKAEFTSCCFCTNFSVVPVHTAATKTQVNSSIGINGNVGGGDNTESNLWIDMNGDGLPDRVSMDGGVKVRLNLGYGLENNYKIWSQVSPPPVTQLKGEQTNFAGGLGFSWADNSYSGGVSASASRAYTKSNIADINGDGLPDLVLNDSGNLKYRINLGNGFSDEIISNVGGYINFNRTIAEGGSVSFTIPLITFFGIKFTPKFNFGAEQSISRVENTIEDVNGDSFPDLLFAGNGNNNAVDGSKTNDGELHARLSNIGTTNYLTKVNTPTGGSWEVAYERQAESNTFEMPQNKYVVSKISIFDGFTSDNNWSPDRTVTSIQYTKPKYDRREREFYGYEKVRVNQHGGYNTEINLNAPIADFPNVYRYSVQEFHNNNYYLKGAIKKESLFDANNVMWTESKTTYGIYQPDTALSLTDTKPVGGTFNDANYNLSGLDENSIKYLGNVTTSTITPNNGFICSDIDHSRLFVTPLVSVKTFTEGGTGLKYAVTSTEGIDAFGNIKQYRDYGEQSTDVYVSKIDYCQPGTVDCPNLQNSFGYPKLISVFNSDGVTLKRERKATYDANGNLSAVITKLNGTENASVTMQYDPDYGNLSKVINENSINSVDGSKFFKKYTYDDILHTYPVRVEDAFGYYSTSSYNYLFGIPVYTTDMNMQPMRTRIDDRGRPIEITGPYELYLEGISGGADPAWTIRFEYQNETAVATSVANYASDQFGTVPADTFNGLVNAVGSFNAIAPNTTQPTNANHHALTRHFDPEFRTGGYDSENVTTTNHILTATIVDGFGKPVQVKKSSAIFDGTPTVQAQGNATPNPLNDNNMVWLLNGKAKTDAYGRAIKSYYPTTQNDTFTGGATDVPSGSYTYIDAADTVAPTEATYDVLDRSLTTKLPGEADETTMEYTIEASSFATKVTNELVQVQKSFTDVRGRTILTQQDSSTGNIATSFVYNNIGELQTVTDVAGNVTSSTYDLAGRRTELRHPDNGITKFTYDKASNLTKRETANLLHAAANESIDYKYTYNRLDEIKYPQFPENDVHYYYGTSGNGDAANDNAVGRLWYHVDATGTQYFKYGKLGELTKNRRSIAVPGDRVYWLQTDWTYDTWNRVKTIKYPDEELVTYRYNKGGELHAMTSEKNGVQNKNIISQLGYDKFGQRTYLRYGNGTETTYNYQAERRRLDRMNVKSNTTFGATTAREFTKNKYTYDVLSNVLSIQNTSTDPTTTQIGGRSSQFYAYDDLNRLTTASGNFVGRNENQVGFNHSRYTMVMGYDSQHNITNKNQVHQTASGTATTPVAAAWNNDKTEQTNYALDYQDYNTAGFTVAGYTYQQPHAPRTIIDQPVAGGTILASDDPRIKTKKYEYDFNGNQIKTTQTVCAAPVPEILRENLWDEENRLRAIDLNPESSTVHPIAIYTYDAGGERIIKQNSATVTIYENAKNVGSTIKSDFMLYPSGMVVARPAADGTGALSYTKHYFVGSQRVSSKIGTTTNLGQFLQEWTLQENSSGGAAINLVATSQNQLTKAQTGVTHVYTAFGITPSPTFNSSSAFVPVASFTGETPEVEQYYFHPDHLGSSNYITNLAGEVSQHMEYFAFGETFVEEHKNSINSPFKFNGKELDEESGLYYYGARYYDPRLSIWASTDPLAEEYSNVSPYTYCLNNPINAIDPDGRRVYFVGGAGNDSDGWNYISRFRSLLGLQDFRRVNASHGKAGDISFVNNFRNSQSFHQSGGPRAVGATMYAKDNREYKKALNGIIKDLKNNPLKEGEQFNLTGYSYGAVLQEHLAIGLADKGIKVDNLILVGSPTSDGSDLMNKLNEYKEAGKIGNIIREDIKGDHLSNPKNDLEFIQGGIQNSPLGDGNDGAHFDLARPGAEANKKIEQLGKKLKANGVE